MLSSGMFWKDCSIFTNKASSTEISRVCAVLTRMCVVCTRVGIDVRTCFLFEDLQLLQHILYDIVYCLSASIIADSVYTRNFIYLC